MQITSIGNLNFGLKFTPEMEDVFKEGRLTALKRNPKLMERYTSEKQKIRTMYNKNFLLHVKTFDSGDRTIFLKDRREELPVEKDPGIPLMTLNKLPELLLLKKSNAANQEERETLDMPRIMLLRQKLEDLKVKFGIK